MRSIIAETIIGFGSGIIVGSGLVALLTVLGIIPRLVQLSKSYTFVKSYQAAVILGGIIGTLFFLQSNFDPCSHTYPSIVRTIPWCFYRNACSSIDRGAKCFSHLNEKIRNEHSTVVVINGNRIRQNFWLSFPLDHLCRYYVIVKYVNLMRDNR